MSDVIQFLENLGSQPQFSPADYAATVAALHLDVAQREALLQQDPEVLRDLLGGRRLMAIWVATPDGGEEPQESPDLPDDDEGVEPEGTPQPDEEPR